MSIELNIIENKEGLEYLKNIEKNSIDLVFTDPPYITSHSTGMDSWVNHVSNRKDTTSGYKSESQFKSLKSPEEWNEWLVNGGHNTPKSSKLALSNAKKNYLKYGSIYGSKYAIETNYGSWDEDFKLSSLWSFVDEFYRTLRKGGTCIIWFDQWKISFLHQAMVQAGFKQMRLIEWVKTNPQPLNSRVNYLTNCREFAVLGVKGAKPTFNSKYDNAIYKYPIQGGKYRIIPTQKSTALCEDLIKKHSNEGDLILDPFMGSGTTAVAAYNTNRKVRGCEMRKDMYDQMIERIKKETGYDFLQPETEEMTNE